MEKVNLAEKFALFADHWNPKIVGELNGQQVKLVKFVGEFVWHKHGREDELFLVIRGCFRTDFRDRQMWLNRTFTGSERLAGDRKMSTRLNPKESSHYLYWAS